MKKIEISIPKINSIINICTKNDKDISSDENSFAKRIINRKNNINNIKETAKTMLKDLTNDDIYDNIPDNIENLLFLKENDELTHKEQYLINKESRKMLLLKKVFYLKNY